MVQKISNYTLKLILMKAKCHRSIDCILCLIDLVKQIKLKNNKFKFIIPTYTNTINALHYEVNLKFPNLINKTTFYDCSKELIALNIIKYNSELQGFEIIDMEKMIVKKNKGFTKLPPFFFQDTFFNMPYVEKRMLLYIVYLLSKKNVSRKFNKDYNIDIICNLNNYRKKHEENELNWLTVCRTQNIYYVKKIISSLSTYYPDLIECKSEILRKEKYGKSKGITRGICVDAIYFLNLKEVLKDQKYNIFDEFLHLSTKYKNLNDKINELCKEKDIKINIATKIALLRRLYKFLPIAQNKLIDMVLTKIKNSIEQSTKQIRNIEAFTQHLINTKNIFKDTELYNKQKGYCT